MALDLSLGISWQFGALAVLSMVLLPHFRGRYAFIAAALGYSLVDIVPALFAGVSPATIVSSLFNANSTSTVGLWTLTGTLTWGLVGFLFTLQKPNGSPLTFAKLGIAGTLIFDTITGPVLSPLIWPMPFWDSLVGQVPFTFKHLIGIAAVSLILAPLLFPSVNKALSQKRWIVLKPAASLS
jgi:hypothetical protein